MERRREYLVNKGKGNQIFHDSLTCMQKPAGIMMEV
jgi:hypothetical protein